MNNLTCIHIYIHTYIHTYILTYMRIYIQRGGRAHDGANAQRYEETQLVSYMCTCICIYVCMCVCMCVCVYKSLARDTNSAPRNAPHARRGYLSTPHEAA